MKQTIFENMGQLKNACAEFETATQKAIFIDGEQSKEYYAIWNNEQNNVASIVSKDYTLVQHKDVFNTVVDVMSRLNLTGNGTVKDFGNRAWVDILLDNKMLKDDEQGIKIGFRFTNSYDKGQRLMCQFYGLRVVCSNGMVARVWGSEANRLHVGEIKLEPLITEMIKTVIEKHEEAQKYIERAIIDSMEWEIVDKIISKLFKERNKHYEVIKKNAELVVAEKGTITRWDLYNIVTAYATHGTDNKLLSTGVETWAQERAEKILLNTVILE